jgi:hypothetical protein
VAHYIQDREDMDYDRWDDDRAGKYKWPGEPDTPQIEEQEFPRYERR